MSYRLNAWLADAATDRVSKHIQWLISSAMAWSRIAKGDLPRCQASDRHCKSKFVFLRFCEVVLPWWNQGRLLSPHSVLPGSPGLYIMSSSPWSNVQATDCLAAFPEVAPLLPLPSNLGPTTHPHDKLLPERGLISDLSKHTKDRKQGCRAPEIADVLGGTDTLSPWWEGTVGHFELSG